MGQVTAAGRARAFSTTGLPPAERVALWEQHNARALVGLSCKTIDDAPLAATELNLQLPSLHFARVTGSPHLVERGAREISDRPTGSAVLYIAMAGEAFFYSTGGTRVLRPGHAVLCDADRPFARGFSQGLEEFVLKIPHDALLALTGSTPEQPEFFDLAGGAPTDSLRALTRVMRASLDGPTDARRTEQQALGLLASLLTGGTSRHLDIARAIIEVHLRDPNLSAARIAARIGISERQLCRVFNRADLSVARYVLDRRLDLARELLRSPRSAHRSIAEIARDCGFVSPSHFTRTFKRRFDVTPAETRRTAADPSA
ncbi:helix-turn-helix domain-containing protein [Saccharopolyspora endophytica]|uniref:Helix-turn-helix domain-containing protein n=1 Tax=Saccharopolyspora endophytica TaxID=543886 RepID=A0ABS5DC95_9PSEU|nr:helix-turn-helix domain-containing protein [Saccharopolyspora endophytica]MBQ0923898.1 helix-turn-helix domain-containing protein [Saccharopolyspora endophytica]